MKSKLASLLVAMAMLSCKKEETPRQLQETPKEQTKVSSGNFYFSKNYEPGKVIKLQTKNGTMYIEQQKDGYYLEGDIRLSQAQFDQLKSGNDSNRRAVIGSLGARWPNKQIPYVINAAATANDIALINAAIQHWEVNTPLRFIIRTTQSDFVEFIPGTGFSSFVGRRGGAQPITFVPGAWFEGPLIHEIGHAAGLFHEQSRIDRDNFIRINWGNIKPEVVHNFKTYLENGYNNGTDLGTFDFGSIMLYASIITDPNFVFNPNIPTITRLDGSTYTENIFSLSQGDIEAVNFIYNNPYFETYLTNYVDNSSTYIDEWYADVMVNAYVDLGNYTPVTLTRPITVRVSQTVEETNQQTRVNYYDVIVPAGANTIKAGTATYFKEYSGGPQDREHRETWVVEKIMP